MNRLGAGQNDFKPMAARTPILSTWFRLTLFITSYLPLWVLLVFNQVTRPVELSWLHWGGFSTPALMAWWHHFAFASFFVVMILYGALSLFIFMPMLRQRAERNGQAVKLLDVRNRNSEAISYIGSYIIPFLFQQYNSLYEKLATGLLIYMVYRIYVHSTLMMINPILTMWYSLYEVDFQDSSGNKKTGMLITRERYLEIADAMRVYPIGPRLYFGITNSLLPVTNS